MTLRDKCKLCGNKIKSKDCAKLGRGKMAGIDDSFLYLNHKSCGTTFVIYKSKPKK